jgi:hypothetical protein
MIRKQKLAILDSRARIPNIYALEGRTPTAQLINEHAHAPYINRIAILNVNSNHLWRQVVWCATYSRPFVGWCMAGPAKVRQVNRLVAPQQVLRLYVPVDYIFPMTVLQSSTHLVYDECCLALLVIAVLF